MFRRKQQPPYAPQLEALPVEERGRVLAPIYILKMHGRQLKKQRVYPSKDTALAFEAVVGLVAAPSVGTKDDQDPRVLFEAAHCLRDGLTLLAAIPSSRGPYGDLLYRVVLAAGLAIGGIYATRVGHMPQIDPADTVDPPKLRLAMDRTVRSFAEALAESSKGTWHGAFPNTLNELAERFGHTPPLIAALVDQRPMAARVHSVEQLGYEELLDMTRDPELARAAASATPV